MSKNIILLTACVNPRGMVYTKIQDNHIRLNQYKDALRWYLENTTEKIVFVENTMCDFSNEFSEYLDSGRLEYITFDGNNYCRELGKGYGEAVIIKRALEYSKLLSSCDNIIKITGRLKVKNVISILKKNRSQNILYANTNLVNGHALCHSVVFIAPIQFLTDFFIDRIDLLNDSKGYYFEHLLYDSMVKWKISGGRHSDFKNPLIIDGVSGSTGEKYMKTIKFMWLKSIISFLAHKYGIYRNHIN